MTGWAVGIGLLGVAGLVVLVYWQLVIAEGAYLGPRVVALTYDWIARRYDAIKQFDPRDERWFVAGPLLRQLTGVRQPLVLDVATGTGRLPMALLANRFPGRIVGLDLSLGMLRQAHRKLKPYGDGVRLIWQDASHLPFDDGAFDAVTCLESLEFLPRPLEALAEMVRVLAPGGVLFLTNRVGREACLLPGKAIPRSQFGEVLASHPLRDLDVRVWQHSYDLAMARKEGHLGSEGQGGVDPWTILRCPRCGGSMVRGVAALTCLCEDHSQRRFVARLQVFRELDCNPGHGTHHRCKYPRNSLYFNGLHIEMYAPCTATEPSYGLPAGVHAVIR
jgi:ubiquinone/menaquinone biosynthesis C-methylase UbiE